MIWHFKKVLIGSVLVFAIQAGAQKKFKPVTPNASSETVSLLSYLQSLAGKHTLSGQHNFPNTGDRNTQFAGDYIGKTPVVWSQDFGFAKEGDKDSYLARPAIVQEAIKQHKNGAIVTLCWHAVPPTAHEPVTFQPLPDYDSSNLASVQGRLLDQQFKDLLTPGTEIYKNWEKQVDEIASHLKVLQQAKVPVIWRPYHELNGNWFWWGGRYEGQHTTSALYKQIFDRMVKHHKLNNLIWVWSVDRPTQTSREFIKYFPGINFMDILALDIYGNDFNQTYYNDLLALAEGKPITLGEVGNPPSADILRVQPKWLYWVVWSGMVRGTSRSDYQKLVDDPHILFLEDSIYIEGTKMFRKSCGFEPLSIHKPADFTGEWLISNCESIIPSGGFGSAPYKLSIHQLGNELSMKSYTESEYSNDEIIDQILTLDGKDVKSVVFSGAPRIQNANWSEFRDKLTIDSNITFKFGNRESKISSKDVWHLSSRGNKLIINRTVNSFRGKQESTLVYYRQR